MSATKQELQSFLERVEKATGPDSALDRDIIKAFDTSWICDFVSWPSRMTSSVDGAIWLVDRQLKGWVCENIGQDAEGRLGEMRGIGWTAEFSNGLDMHQGQAPTLPLAILAALLKALIAQADEVEG